MGVLIGEVVQNQVFVTRYEFEGAILPHNIKQKQQVIDIINNNLDMDEYKEEVVTEENLAVTREAFLLRLLKMGEGCLDEYGVYGKGLYSINDMQKGITWAEVAYLLHYVGGLDTSIDWNTIKPSKADRVCVLQEIVNGEKRLDQKLASYKSRLDMERYISSIVSGKRYIPLPLYCSYIDLLNNDGLEVELTEDMMFKKMSESELNKLFS